MSHPLRSLFEKLGWVRSRNELNAHFKEADEVARQGKLAAAEARRERLQVEVRSMRRENP